MKILKLELYTKMILKMNLIAFYRTTWKEERGKK